MMEQAEKLQAEEKTKSDFFSKLEQSADMHDNLEELTNFLQKHTQATGVYIGKLVYPMKTIEDDAGEDEHEDREAPKVIRYIHATENHKYLIDRCLAPDQGITHDVFKEQSQAAPEDQEDGGDMEEGAPKSARDQDIVSTFKHVYVPEVVREPRIMFHKVPKLGAYMAVPLCYQSCLFDDALEQAVADMFDV
jgi:hypothetical protein